MKITVKLFGTLAKGFSGYDPVTGMDIDIPDGAKIMDIFAHLDIPEHEGCFVSMNNRVVKKDQKLISNATVHILQALAGG